MIEKKNVFFVKGQSKGLKEKQTNNPLIQYVICFLRKLNRCMNICLQYMLYKYVLMILFNVDEQKKLNRQVF